MAEKFYISTAITYTSSKPHIGNTYEVVLADAIARFKRFEGYDVYFQTGTDEHGEKIEIKAREAGLEPQEYVNNIAHEIQRIWDIMNTSYDKFVRTTDIHHKEEVQKIFKKLYDQGDIYKSQYQGLYCVPCESFWTETQAENGICPDCGRPVTSKTEEAYFFKLYNYQDKLTKYINEHPDFIRPESRKNEMINNFIKPGLQDLCVSRTSFKWGVPVTFDNNHVIYVWIDALSNYITNIGYDVDKSSDKFNYLWPADIHLIGKDIIRFHTIYWPIILMALNLPLPKTVYGHPWLLFDNDKMSKSKGNVLYADELAQEFGVDKVRYYLLHEMPYANDGTITKDLLIERTNSDLANILGNLVTRTVSMANKYFDGIITNPKVTEDIDNNLISSAENLIKEVSNFMNEYKVADALECIITFFRKCNKYIDDTTPWTLAKDETKLNRLKTVIYNLIESIRISASLLQSFLPEAAKRILKNINANVSDYASCQKFGYYAENTKVNASEIVFERLDK